MSKVHIKRLVENIPANTTIYTPIVEVIVNGIQAVDETARSDGKLRVRAVRSAQAELDGGLGEVVGFAVEDNGIGFTDVHRDSFDTLYTDLKIGDGGKGFGRFIGLKYFEDLQVKSVYRDGIAFKSRSFSIGDGHQIIVHEQVKESAATDTGSTVTLARIRSKHAFDKKLSTIARHLVERLLPYFITQGYTCPDIVLCEEDGGGEIRLNDFVSNELSAVIREIRVENQTFTLKAAETEETFCVRVFKLYSPRKQTSRISLVAHRREVSGAPIKDYIPEFEDEFYDKGRNGEIDRERNYIVKAYVFGPYLDRHVSVERGGFEFPMQGRDLCHGIAQNQIESGAAVIARAAVGEDVALRQQRKKECVQAYVDDEAPWHKTLLEKIDLSSMPCNPSNEEIEARLQKEKFADELAVRREVAELLKGTGVEQLKAGVTEIVNKVSGNSRNELIHYIALRRAILEIFGKSLEVDASGAYCSEGVVHDIIFPRKGDSDATPFQGHNLWIVDERLNFTNWVSSDVPLDRGHTERPDLLVYNRRVLFRGDNEPSNPITIFEFKRPQRDDFVNPSSREDPVQQIVRYVNDIRDNKFKTPAGRKMLVADNTPFYGYVVCDITRKVETWLEREKDFTPMPDRQGWFHWMKGINLYVEVISWDKVLKDAKMRNQIFFQKLVI
ncbi:ATP-binding protein [Accumulibacter sp.]|uniref:ATP-binding protein n=1 Tax=Accumulibacter sp. TaxID=2053492 RepID=UPI002878F0FB|nr:ATP-binding protein [Accumulibacter sp.]MDS4056443.1 ATP-binding protein [Accumulibacter sp.]HMW55136.1 ATP-binding protein [Accumulibacter sp.]HMW79190.1 ATP-binding protein [Accumulibacter sp.]